MFTSLGRDELQGETRRPFRIKIDQSPTVSFSTQPLSQYIAGTFRWNNSPVKSVDLTLNGSEWLYSMRPITEYNNVDAVRA